MEVSRVISKVSCTIFLNDKNMIKLKLFKYIKIYFYIGLINFNFNTLLMLW